MAFRLLPLSKRLGTSGINRRSIFTVPEYLAIPPKVSTLPNGLRVISEVRPGELATISVRLRAGSDNETETNNGVANLLQTTLTHEKGRQVRNIGGSFTGRTTRDATLFTTSCVKHVLPEVINILGDVVQSDFSTESVERARSIVLEGRKTLWDTVNETVMMDYLYSAAYQGSSLETTPEGEIATIKALKRTDLESFRSSRYTGQNVIVSAVGDVDHSNLTAEVEKVLGNLPRGTASLLSETARVPFTGSQMNIRDDTVHKVQLAIGYETVSISHQHVLTFALIAEMIGSWTKNSLYGNFASSRLAEQIATQKLGDEFKVFNHHYKNTGIFGVYASTHDVDVLDDFVYLIFSEFQKLSAYIQVDECHRAKNLLKNRLLMANLKSYDAAETQAANLQLLNRHPPLVELLARIDEIRVSNIVDVIATYFYDVDPVVIAHGPLDEMLEYSIIRGWTKWNRW
eukprot:TRINITY_DN9457_c0_g1_i5.p1 TRINITY_DN9457_c0_g1~~TRINITY_DN9457_c0_g1_i5.p1  ORF type:complete len:458 (-),score=55.09 TRINITY_DN9457_c0_g1_i5:210-1583(-)